MKAEPNPSKVTSRQINNQFNDRINSTPETLAKVLRRLRSDTNLGRSSTASSIVPEKLERLKDVYNHYDTGLISKQQFQSSLRDDFQIPVTEDLDKVLSAGDRSYKKLLTKIGISGRSSASGDFFISPRLQSVRNSCDLTTVASARLHKEKIEAPDLPSTDVDYDNLSKTIRNYSIGQISSGDFRQFLHQNHIPITSNLDRDMKIQDETRSVPFHKIGKDVYTALCERENTSRLAGNPNKKDPMSFRYINNAPPVRVTPMTKEKMKQEHLAKELKKLNTGGYYQSRRSVSRTYDDNGDLTSWNPEEAQSVRSKKIPHLKHTEIFATSDRREVSSFTGGKYGSRFMSNGNIITWDS